MPKEQPVHRHAAVNCACDECWKPTPESERRAAEYWRDPSHGLAKG